jgi:NDP-sugar pyrophosphorylase family protein
MMKKTVLGLTIAVMVSAVGTALFGQNAADFQYTVNNGGVTITGYTGSAKGVTIPGLINNLPVTEIGDGAFRGKELTSITLPNSVILIGEQAFEDNKLTSVIIGANVTVAENSFDTAGTYKVKVLRIKAVRSVQPERSAVEPNYSFH